MPGMHRHASCDGAPVTKTRPGQDAAIHGSHWDSVHGGYFSDLAVAAPLLEKIEAEAARTRAAVVVDLGGGTGFLLSQLATRGNCAGARFINLDSSAEQLAATRERAVQSIRTSVDRFSRAEAVPQDVRVVWIMRSVLHYFGEPGLPPVLAHLRRQAKNGESFVHQTACFEQACAAECLNLLYRWMHTGKWYPTTAQLRRMLGEAGWRVDDLSAAPALPLTAHDLSARYGIAEETVTEICAGLERKLGLMPGVLEVRPNRACAYLHYRIAVCTAV